MKPLGFKRLFLIAFIALLVGGGVYLALPRVNDSPTLSPNSQRFLAASPPLTFAVTRERPPLVQRSENGTLKGFLVEYILALGIPLNTAVHVELMTEAEAQMALQNGAILGIADSSPSPGGFNQYHFSQPYLEDTVKIYYSPSHSGARSLDDLKNRKVSVVSGSPAESLVEKSQAHPIAVQDSGAALQMVEQGQADAYVGSDLETLNYLDTYPSRLAANIVSVPIDRFPYAIAVSASDDRSLEIVNWALYSLRVSGLGSRIQESWFGAPLIPEVRVAVPTELWWGIGISGLVVAIGIILMTLHDYSLNKQVRARTSELAESEEKYRLLIEDANDAILLIDPESGSILEANRFAETLFHYERGDLLRLGLSGLQWRADFERTLPELQRIVREGDGTLDKVSLVDARGESRFAEVKVNRLNFKQKSLAQCIARDISERVRAQEDLTRQNRLLKEVNQFAARLDPLQDPLSIVRVATDVFGELFRVEITCLISQKEGAPAPTIYCSGFREEAYEQVRQFTLMAYGHSLLRESNSPVVYQVESIDAEGKANFPTISNYQILGIYFPRVKRQGELFNMFSRRRASLTSEEELLLNALAKSLSVALEKAVLFEELKDTVSRLNAQRRFNDSILNNVTNGILTIGRGGEILSVNRAAEVILGYPSRDLIGKPLRLLGTAFQDLSRSLEPVLNESDSYISQEVVLPTSRGVTIPVGMALSPLRNSDQLTTGAILVFTDLSEIKRLEEERLKMERLAMLGNMSAMMAHEIRNPLAGINAGIQYLNMRYAIDPATSESIKMIIQESERLNALIDDILSFSRERPLNLTATRLPMLMDLILARWGERAKAQNIEIVREYSPDLPDIRVDAMHLDRGIENLIRNAFEAMQPNGNGRLWVTLCTENSMNGHGPRSEFVIRVANSGKPIPPEVASHIFEPFYTTKVRGTGLGLPIAKRSVEDHKGELTLESQGSRAAIFTIRLPLDL